MFSHLSILHPVAPNEASLKSFDMDKLGLASLEITKLVDLIEKTDAMGTKENIEKALPLIAKKMKECRDENELVSTFNKLGKKAAAYVLIALAKHEKSLFQTLGNNKLARNAYVNAENALLELPEEYYKEIVDLGKTSKEMVEYAARKSLSNPLKQVKIIPLNAFVKEKTGFTALRDSLIRLTQLVDAAKAALKNSPSDENKKRVDTLEKELKSTKAGFEGHLKTIREFLTKQYEKEVKKESSTLQAFARAKVDKEMAHLEHFYAQSERFAQGIGMVPLLGSLIAGTIATVIANAQVIHSVSMLTFNSLKWVIAKYRKDDGAKALASAFITRRFNHIIHASANFGNAMIDFNPLGWIYRIINHFVTKIRFVYTTETPVKGEYRIGNNVKVKIEDKNATKALKAKEQKVMNQVYNGNTFAATVKERLETTAK